MRSDFQRDGAVYLNTRYIIRVKLNAVTEILGDKSRL